MSKKVPWRAVFDDFKKNHPRLRTKAVWWCPQGFMTILIYFDDGKKGTYDGLKHEFKYTGETWKHEKG